MKKVMSFVYKRYLLNTVIKNYKKWCLIYQISLSIIPETYVI